MPFYRHFELDIISAMRDQIVAAFSGLEQGELTHNNISSVPDQPGVYHLHHQHQLVYVGKADNLQKRLQEHREKISGRRNLNVSDIHFTCVSVTSGIEAFSEVGILGQGDRDSEVIPIRIPKLI